MAHGFNNRVYTSTSTTGTGNVTIGTAKPAHCTPAQAGTQNGDTRTWLLEEGNDFEIFRGAYTSSGTVVTRGTVLLSQIAGVTGTSKMNLLGTASIREVAAAEDLLSIVNLADARATLGVRELLSANRTYYCRGDGNDSNDGLSNTAGGAFRNLQKAMDVIASLDLGIYSVTINCAAAAYSALTLKTIVGAGTVQFIGDETTQSNCTISNTGQCVTSFTAKGTFIVAGFKIASSTSQDAFAGSGNLTLRNCEYAGVANFRIYATSGGVITCNGTNNKMSGGGIGMFLVDGLGYLDFSNSTWAVTQNVTFSTFCTSRNLGYCLVIGAVFNLGAFTVTASRYSVTANAVIIGSGGGANFFPGTTAGVIASGGQYL